MRTFAVGVLCVCFLCILSLPELKFEKPLLSLNQIRIVPFVKEK